MNRHHRPVRRRDDSYVARPATRIWREVPAPDHPFLAQQAFCHGYDLMELMARRRFPETLYLLFRGELPSPEQGDLLERLMIAAINPGPRHPACRAAQYASVSKSDPANVLPIALNILGGAHNGAAVVEPAMRFLRRKSRVDAAMAAAEVMAACPAGEPEEEWSGAPGFGRRFGGVDPIPARLAAELAALPGAGRCLRWGNLFAARLAHYRLGWLLPGVVAATLADLGFSPRAGTGLFQLFCAPGLLAHGVEMANKPVTEMPFVTDENYVIETD